MSIKMLYLLGYPGAGKTTTLAYALQGVLSKIVYDPFVMTTYYRDIPARGGNQPKRQYTGIQLGADRAKLAKDAGQDMHALFSGTDVLGMNVQPEVVDWLEMLQSQGYSLSIVAEGDRLGNGSFFQAVTMMGIDLTVALAEVDLEEASQRRMARAEVLNKKAQDAKWVRGRISKVNNLAREWVDPSYIIDMSRPPQECALHLMKHPVIQAIRGEAHSNMASG